jgi:pyridoxamine 5'-phosphate oxidase
MSKISELRINYTKNSLDINEVTPNPKDQFEKWFNQAVALKSFEANAFVLSTVGADLFPSSRVVLLKGLDGRGFIFFTNYESQKSVEMEANNRISACFFWPEMERQIRINGTASKISKEETEIYFHSRPRESQIGAWASPQSAEITSREWLEARFSEMSSNFKNVEKIPVPDHWGGWLLSPISYEFWQGRSSRLHDRIRYVLNNDGTWDIKRIAP